MWLRWRQAKDAEVRDRLMLPIATEPLIVSPAPHDYAMNCETLNFQVVCEFVIGVFFKLGLAKWI
jgi:hypothetical protein